MFIYENPHAIQGRVRSTSKWETDFFAHQTSHETELTQTNIKHMGFRNISTTLVWGIFHREMTKY